ncbi:MAG: hypothetical protein NVS3B27_22660 [Novosphingobium sp.]
MIVGINAWDDHAKGKPFNWANLMYGVGFVAFTGILAVWMWLIYKFVLRYAEHRDRQQP